MRNRKSLSIARSLFITRDNIAHAKKFARREPATARGPLSRVIGACPDAHFRRQRGAMPASPLCPGPHWAVCGPDEGRRARDLRGDGVATKRDKQLAKLLPVLREGDTLQVTRLDRLSAHSR